MNPVRDALETKLKADATLVAFLSSAEKIVHRRPLSEKAMPWVIIDKQSGRDAYSFGGRAFLDQVWLVKAVDRGHTADRAEDIAARIDVVLDNATLTLTSGAVVWCRRESEVDYGEPISPDAGPRDPRRLHHYHHVGGLFRVVSIP